MYDFVCVYSVLDRTDHPWHVVYDFVTDRLRSIRQDITYQVAYLYTNTKVMCTMVIILGTNWA